MNADLVRSALRDIALVRRVYFFDEIVSTMDWAKDLVQRANGSEDLSGTLVIANHQTAGRGRFDRKWSAPAGRALLLSFIVSARSHGTSAEDVHSGLLPSLREIAVAVPVAACEAISEVAGVKARIKFPNDIVASGKKCGGVLLESVSANGRTFAIAGLGINVNQRAEELPPDARVLATSLFIEGGSEATPDHLLAAIMRSLSRLLAHPEAAVASMNLLCETIGAHVHIATLEGEIEGIASGVTQEGGLVVRMVSGIEKVIHSGDVLQLTAS